ncbi:MAG: hypothetical protein SOU49_08370 [Sodaliphilus pleomorphus]|uniref:hypothetical protein n=1 Tax=Sodaliphilus pleomorphus TaxID=2606626 RepID=UPI002A7667EB|nr:hypothetical protein [Sodaliphilus pleomorphus]MDY2832741.1 hypothetical protein [Sodaliphilus pleomorphus]
MKKKKMTLAIALFSPLTRARCPWQVQHPRHIELPWLRPLALVGHEGGKNR